MHSDGFTPKLSIVIPVCGQVNFTNKCFKYIAKFTTIPYEVIWIDNGSNPRHLAHMANVAKHVIPRTKLINLNRNLGFIKATNIGIKESSGDFIVLLNNDT